MKAIVIGGTGTIGSAVAKALAAKGHAVVAASRHGEVRVDVEDAAAIEAMFNRVGEVDAVCCCAGDAAFKPFAELTAADYALGVRSKLMGQVTVANVASRHLRDNGAIVLTAGVLAREPMVGSAAISLVNAALEGFVRAAAMEMPRGLRINVVSPPWVNETLARLGMHGVQGLPAAGVARAYVAAVEGTRCGETLDPRRLH